jgi:hypothetical protein
VVLLLAGASCGGRCRHSPRGDWQAASPLWPRVSTRSGRCTHPASALGQSGALSLPAAWCWRARAPARLQPQRLRPCRSLPTRFPSLSSSRTRRRWCCTSTRSVRSATRCRARVCMSAARCCLTPAAPAESLPGLPQNSVQGGGGEPSVQEGAQVFGLPQGALAGASVLTDTAAEPSAAQVPVLVVDGVQLNDSSYIIKALSAKLPQSRKRPTGAALEEEEKWFRRVQARRLLQRLVCSHLCSQLGGWPVRARPDAQHLSHAG